MIQFYPQCIGLSMRLIIGWEPLSSQIELEPRLPSVIFSFGEWLVSSLPASSGQIELVEHKSRSGERFFNSIPPNVKLVLGEVFLKKKRIPLPDTDQRAFILSSEYRSYVI